MSASVSILAVKRENTVENIEVYSTNEMQFGCLFPMGKE